MKKLNNTYWYLITIYYCVICGKEDKYRERIYDKPKPENWNERNIFIENMCDKCKY